MSGEYSLPAAIPLHRRPAMRLRRRWVMSEDLMTAPAAFVRAATRRDERDRTLPMGVVPGADISPDVDGVARRPWLCVQIRDLGARCRPPHQAVVIQEKRCREFWRKSRLPLLAVHRRSSSMVISPSPKTTKSAPDSRYSCSIGSRFRAAHHRPPARLACDPQNVDHVLAGH